MSKLTLAIVLPIHNERETLTAVIQSWHEVISQLTECKHQFILCEDGSTDGTKALIQELKKNYPIIDNSVSERRGYGRAVLSGIHKAQADYVLCIDSDGQCQAHNFPQFWHSRDQADFIIGWRKPRRDPSIRIIYSKLFYVAHRLLFPNRLHDPSCPFVLGKRSAYLDISPYLLYMREGFWWGFVAACVKCKKSIFELLIEHAVRNAGKTQVYHFKKMPSIIWRNLTGLIKLKLAR